MHPGDLFAALLLLLLVASCYYAQAQDGLDLPIEPPVFRGQGTSHDQGTRPPPPPEDGDDPRDTPPPTFYGEDLDCEGEALVYVLDLSCSMSIMEPDPYEVAGVVQHGTRRARALAELAASLDSLAESFRFTVVRYGTGFVAFSAQLVPATRENKAAAVQWTSEAQCLGMTTTGPAVVFALALEGHEHVVLLTDGAPNWDGASVREPAWHRQVIRDSNSRSVTIDVFGLRPLPVCRAFAQGVARDSGGLYFEID